MCADDSSVQVQEDVEVVCESSSRADSKVITLASVQARKVDEHLKMPHLKQAKGVEGDGIRNFITHVHVGYMVPCLIIITGHCFTSPLDHLGA